MVFGALPDNKKGLKKPTISFVTSICRRFDVALPPHTLLAAHESLATYLLCSPRLYVHWIGVSEVCIIRHSTLARISRRNFCTGDTSHEERVQATYSMFVSGHHHLGYIAHRSIRSLCVYFWSGIYLYKVRTACNCKIREPIAWILGWLIPKSVIARLLFGGLFVELIWSDSPAWLYVYTVYNTIIDTSACALSMYTYVRRTSS